MENTHPTFGTINLYRVQSSGEVLFQSAFSHHNYIAIEINEALVDRKLNKDWVRPSKNIARVLLSETQFAQFITSSGLGGGVPCTLNRVMGQGRGECPVSNERELFHAEFKEATDEIRTEIKNLASKTRDLLVNSKLTKAEKAELTKIAADLERKISDLPYIEEKFEEATEKTVSYAKSEIEAHLGARSRELLGSDTGNPLNLSLE